jgi:hypothetical protein
MWSAQNGRGSRTKSALPDMPQSNVIFAFLLVAFIMFVTMKGELPIYLGFFLSSPQGSSGTGSASNILGSVGNVANAFGNISSTLNNLGGIGATTTIGGGSMLTGGDQITF